MTMDKINSKVLKMDYESILSSLELMQGYAKSERNKEIKKEKDTAETKIDKAANEIEKSKIENELAKTISDINNTPFDFQDFWRD